MDDAPLNRAILREMLGDTFQLAEAADGAECMAQLEKYGTDIALVLLDMIMPGMDGIQVLEEMQSRELLDDIPVIMITADTSAENIATPMSWAWRITSSVPSMCRWCAAA